MMMTYNQWQKTYNPLTNGKGLLYLQSEDVKRTNPRHIWTLNAYGQITPGASVADVLAYIVTEKPHNGEALIIG